MSFFHETKIAKWQCIERRMLALAFEKAKPRIPLSMLDQRRIKAARRKELLAVNSYSRLDWNEAVCAQLGSFFYANGDGRNHREVLFVTLCDERCVGSADDPLSAESLQRVKNRVCYGLRGLSHLAVIEPAYYVNFQSGFHGGKSKRCISWHLHALVWGISKHDMHKRLRRCRRRGWYIALGKGLKPTQVKPINQGRLPLAVGYLLKSPVSAYRVSMVDRIDKQGRAIVDKDGVVLRKFKQGKSPLRPGERLTLYRAMRHLYLDDLMLAGGEGRPLLATAKRVARPKPLLPRKGVLVRKRRPGWGGYRPS